MRLSLTLIVILLLGGIAALLIRTDRGERVADSGSRATDSGGGARKSDQRLERSSASGVLEKMVMRRFERALAEWRENGTPGADQEGLKEMIANLSAEDVALLFVRWTSGEEEVTTNNRALIPFLVRRWVELAPDEAWAALHDCWGAQLVSGLSAEVVRWQIQKDPARENELRELVAKQGPPLERIVAECFDAALRGWAESDPFAAFEAFVAHRDQVVRKPGHGVYKYLDKLPEVLVKRLAEENPQRAWGVLDELQGAAEQQRGYHGYYCGLPEDWDWAMEGARYRSESTRAGRHLNYVPVSAVEVLAHRWMRKDANAAIQWYVDRDPGSYTKEELAADRAATLLGALHRDEPEQVMRWFENHGDSIGKQGSVATSFLHRVGGLDAVTAILPMIESEEDRFAYMRERASPLDPRQFGRAHNIAFMSWTPEDLAAALRIAALTPEHAAEIQWVVDNGRKDGALIPGNVDLLKAYANSKQAER